MTCRLARRTVATMLALTATFGAASISEAQNFGRNKVQYKDFQFEVLKTEHFHVFFYPDDAERETARASVYRRAVTLEDALGRAVTWDEAAAAVRDGFREVFAVDLIPGTLTDAEARAADQAECDRYASTAKLITRG